MLHKILSMGVFQLCLVGFLLGPANAQELDLSDFTQEHHPTVFFRDGSPFADTQAGGGSWELSGNKKSVTQTVNGQPTMFCSPFPILECRVEFDVQVDRRAGDDDYMGFALGVDTGGNPFNDPEAHYAIVDWKQGGQTFDFGSPSDTCDGIAKTGLAASEVLGTGIPTADEFWGHGDLLSGDSCDPATGNIEELSRGVNLGDEPWLHGDTYHFTVDYGKDELNVSVDNALEIATSSSSAGGFPAGRFCFYAFSQKEVTFSGLTVDCDFLPPGEDPPGGGGPRMTGGGTIGNSTYRHGFELHCDDTSLPNNLEINWGNGNRFHLTSLLTADCSDDPFFDEEHPVAGFDTFVGYGEGRLNGVNGATIDFTFTDYGEPGKNADYAQIEITGRDGEHFYVDGLLNKGNHQAHPH